MNRSNLVTLHGRSGDITIGSAYIPPPPQQGQSADLIQRALLEPPAPIWERALDVFNRYVPHLFVAVFLVGLLLAATRKLWA